MELKSNKHEETENDSSLTFFNVWMSFLHFGLSLCLTKVPQRVHFSPGRFMYIYNDSNSISGTIAPGENLFKLCVKKQAVFGTAES